LKPVGLEIFGDIGVEPAKIYSPFFCVGNKTRRIERPCPPRTDFDLRTRSGMMPGPPNVSSIALV